MFRVRRNQDGKLDSAIANSVNGAGSSSLRSAAKLGALVVALVGSAGLLSASIDSPGWIAAVTLLPLLLAIRTFAPLTALACGVVWGASLFAFLTLAGHNSGTSLVFSASRLHAAVSLPAWAMSPITCIPSSFRFRHVRSAPARAGVDIGASRRNCSTSAGAR